MLVHDQMLLVGKRAENAPGKRKAVDSGRKFAEFNIFFTVQNKEILIRERRMHY